MTSELSIRVAMTLQNYGIDLPVSPGTSLEALLLVISKLETMLSLSVHSETILTERIKRQRDAYELLRLEFALVKDELEEYKAS